MASDGQKLLDLIAEHAGDEKVAAFLELRGGGFLVLPGKPADDHWFSVLVGGGDIARKIVEAMGYTNHKGDVGGFRFVLPIAERSSAEKNRREIRRRLKLGQSFNRIAREVGVHKRTVERQYSALKKLANQNAANHTRETSSC